MTKPRPRKFPRPITYIEPFTGKAAAWLRRYLEKTHADPKEQEKVNQRIREGARRSVSGKGLGDEEAAKLFHEVYERLAPQYGYTTRKDSAVPWEEVPGKNRALMIAVAGYVLDEVRRRGLR